MESTEPIDPRSRSTPPIPHDATPDDRAALGILASAVDPLTTGIRGWLNHSPGPDRTVDVGSTFGGATLGYADVVLNARSGIAVVAGAENHFQVVNPAFQRLFPAHQLLGRSIHDALPGMFARRVERMIDLVHATRQGHVLPEEPVMLVVDGAPEAERHIYEFAYDPLLNRREEVDGILITAVDVTRHVEGRERAEQARHAALDARVAAERLSSAKTRFLATMSHELRTPLSTISGYVEMLELELHGPLTESQRDHIRRIRRNEAHLLGILNTVLEFSRIENGSMPYHVATISVDATLESIEPMVAPLLAAQGITFEYVISNSRLRVLADGPKLHQIVLNLVTNAIKFSDRGSRVRLACIPADQAVSISVTDSGIGIPEENFERIFRPFVQLDESVTRTRSGMGLGLAISREFARAMGGEITVHSQIGRGSTFTLTLPRG